MQVGTRMSKHVSAHVSAREDEVLQRAAFVPAVPERRILCATDLTLRSERAMKRTALLARQMNAQAFFMHAVSDKLSGRVLRMKVSRAYTRLASESERVMRHAPYDATAAVDLGKPLDAVIAAARDYKPDLIVMAQPKRRRLDAMIGTTAERVVRGTGCSVLLTSGAADRAYERVVLATDLTSASEHVTRTAVEMGVLADAETWVVHAFGLPYHDIGTSDAFRPVAGATRQDQWHSAARRDVLRSLDEVGADLARFHILTEQTSAPNAIRRALDDVQPELLVIGVSRWLAIKRILVGSVADQVFRSANCDVLAIAPPAAEKKWLYAA